MAASFSDIKHWFERGVSTANTHMIVINDMFDMSDYPIYVRSRQQAKDYKPESGYRIMEVYHLKGDMEAQMKQHRCFEYGPEEPEAEIA